MRADRHRFQPGGAIEGVEGFGWREVGIGRPPQRFRVAVDVFLPAEGSIDQAIGDEAVGYRQQ